MDRHSLGAVALLALLALPALAASARAGSGSMCVASVAAPTCTFRCDGAGLGWYNLVMVIGDGTAGWIWATMACGSTAAPAFGSDVGMPAGTEMENFLVGEGQCALVHGQFAACGNSYLGSPMDLLRRHNA